MLHERTALSRREPSFRPACARRSRHRLGSDSVWSKLPPLYVPVSPSPVSRGASRDFAALGRPFDDGRVQTANVALNTSTLSVNIVDNSIFMFTRKRLYISDISDDTRQDRRVF